MEDLRCQSGCSTLDNVEFTIEKDRLCIRRGKKETKLELIKARLRDEPQSK
jgi:hypothetical protein